MSKIHIKNRKYTDNKVIQYLNKMIGKSMKQFTELK